MNLLYHKLSIRVFCYRKKHGLSAKNINYAKIFFACPERSQRAKKEAYF